MTLFDLVSISWKIRAVLVIVKVLSKMFEVINQEILIFLFFVGIGRVSEIKVKLDQNASKINEVTIVDETGNEKVFVEDKNKTDNKKETKRVSNDAQKPKSITKVSKGLKAKSDRGNNKKDTEKAKNDTQDLNVDLNIDKKSNQPILKISEEKEIEKHLQNIRSILLNSNATPIRRHTGMGYICCFCNDNFLIPKDLKSHTIDQHDDTAKLRFMRGCPLKSYVVKLDITGLKCKICNEDINSLEQILDHLKLMHSETIYSDIKNYIVPFKFEGEEFNCIYCPNKYSRFKMLQEHMNHHLANHICKVCNAPFVNSRTLRGHMTRHKQGEFPCTTCRKVFDTPTKKYNHEKFVHSGNPKRNKCSFCAEKFTSYALKNDHMVKEHGVEQVVLNCLACDKSFTRRARLNLHVKRDHLLERNYGCDHCEKKFYDKKELSNHMLKHTGAKPHVCQVCSKAFGRKHTLKEHLRIHANDRRFKCEHCGLAFVQKCSWKSHLRSKHEELFFPHMNT